MGEWFDLINIFRAMVKLNGEQVMEISLYNFSYFICLTANIGALTSMKMEFKPYLHEGRAVYDIKAAARGCIDRYTEVLDPHHNNLIDGKK